MGYFDVVVCDKLECWWYYVVVIWWIGNVVVWRCVVILLVVVRLYLVCIVSIWEMWDESLIIIVRWYVIVNLIVGKFELNNKILYNLIFFVFERLLVSYSYSIIVWY